MKKTPQTYCKPNFFRYLAVLIYDAFLLLSVLLLAGAVAVAFNAIANKGQAIEPGNPFFFIYLLAISFLFYGWFWTHGGQTLGMRSWKVHLICDTESSISWQRAFIRFSVALISWASLGIGFLWLYLTKDNQSWHDTMSGTRLHYSKTDKPTALSKLSE